MRTTLNLDDALATAAKKRAAEEGRPLTRLIEDALRSYLAPASEAEPFRLELLTRRGTVQPGIDLADRDALYELMDKDP